MSHARGRYLGMETELISVAEAKKLMPLLEEEYFVGAMYDAHEGHVDPSGVTNAYAIAARQAGAEIYRKTWARDITRASDGGWDVHLMKTEGEKLGQPGEDLGTIHCEHIVNAGGLWAREVGRMVGLELPVLAMEHMYLLTEDIPAVAEYTETHGEVLHCIDFAGEIYMRQEGGGLLLGTYERGGVPWSPKTTPWDFGQRLLSPDLDRIADSLDVGFKHFPVFADAGIKTVINGPFTFSPDGNPLLGPVRGLPGYWSACAVMAGLSQGGGVGLALANWMTEGDPGFDIANAVWGTSFGLETPLWFQAEGEEPVEEITFKRSNSWDQVQGGLIGDLTVACLPPATGAALGGLGTIVGGATGNTSHLESFMVFGSGIAERYYERWFETQQVAFTDAGGASVTFRALGYEMCGLSIAGPNARKLLEKLTDDDVSAENFGFMRFRRIDLGLVPVLCGKVSFSGIGRDALVAKAAAGPDKMLVTFTVDVGEGSDAADVIGDEPVWFTASGGDGPVVDGQPGAVVGWVTSGGYAHGSEASVALAYVPAALVGADGSFEVEVLGVRRWAKLQSEPLFDPAGDRMRS